jgi:hypothetical protein
MFASRTSPSAARRIMAWTGAAGCCALGGYGLHTYYEQRHSTPPIDAALQVRVPPECHGFPTYSGCDADVATSRSAADLLWPRERWSVGRGWLSAEHGLHVHAFMRAQPGRGLSCPLLQVERLNHNTSRFRFGLPTEEHVLGLPAASHGATMTELLLPAAPRPIEYPAELFPATASQRASEPALVISSSARHRPPLPIC